MCGAPLRGCLGCQGGCGGGQCAGDVHAADSVRTAGRGLGHCSAWRAGSAARVAQRQRGWRSRRYSWCWSQGALAGPARAVVTPRVTWSAPKLVDGLPPFGDPAVRQSIACPGPTLCLSVCSEGSVKTSRDPSNVGSGWKATHGVDRGLTLRHVSCPSVSRGVALDDAGQIVTSKNPVGGAGAWKTANLHMRALELGGLSCPSARFVSQLVTHSRRTSSSP